MKEIHKEAYSNMIKAGIYIRQTEGIKGFYRGFVPALLIYCGMFFEDLLELAGYG